MKELNIKTNYSFKLGYHFVIISLLINIGLCNFCEAQMLTHLKKIENENEHEAHFLQRSINLKPFVIPGLLMSSGVVLNKTKWLVLDQNIKYERDENFSRFKNNADDYLQFGPILVGYVAGLAKDKDHQIWIYTKRLFMTEALIGLLVPRLKTLSRVTNPDSDSYNAFPSGHTAQAFAAATLFCDHFANHKPLLIGLAYSTATAVGCLRILNNKHWATDVIAGAGFGVFSAKISELFFNNKSKRITDQL